MPTTPPPDGRGTGRAPALSRQVPGAPAAAPGTRGETLGNVKAALIAAAIGFILGGMISTAIFGDDSIGIELRHLAIALPASAVAGLVGYLTRHRPGLAGPKV